MAEHPPFLLRLVFLLFDAFDGLQKQLRVVLDLLALGPHGSLFPLLALYMLLGLRIVS